MTSVGQITTGRLVNSPSRCRRQVEKAVGFVFVFVFVSSFNRSDRMTRCSRLVPLKLARQPTKPKGNETKTSQIRQMERFVASFSFFNLKHFIESVELMLVVVAVVVVVLVTATFYLWAVEKMVAVQQLVIVEPICSSSIAARQLCLSICLSVYLFNLFGQAALLTTRQYQNIFQFWKKEKKTKKLKKKKQMKKRRRRKWKGRPTAWPVKKTSCHLLLRADWPSRKSSHFSLVIYSTLDGRFLLGKTSKTMKTTTSQYMTLSTAIIKT